MASIVRARACHSRGHCRGCHGYFHVCRESVDRVACRCAVDLILMTRACSTRQGLLATPFILAGAVALATAGPNNYLIIT
jgi:hypothetical protein